MANPLSKTRRADWMATLALVLFASPALAQTPVTQPAGLLTNPNPTLLSDPNAADTWLRRNVRSGGAVGIDPTYPRAGDASMFMELGAPNAGNIGKADAEYYPTASFGRLADLGTISYEWYRDAASQASAWLHPAYRLVVDADGNPLTTNDIGYLIFERCYNVPGCPAVPTNTWVADSITSSTILWWFQIGVGAETVYTRTLATYQSGAYTPSPGFAQLGPNSRVIGISLGVGSGWGGTPAFRGAVDLVRITSNTPGAASIFHNFELASDMAAVSITGLPGILGPGQSGERRHGNLHQRPSLRRGGQCRLRDQHDARHDQRPELCASNARDAAQPGPEHRLHLHADRQQHSRRRQQYAQRRHPHRHRRRTGQ